MKGRVHFNFMKSTKTLGSFFFKYESTIIVIRPIVHAFNKSVFFLSLEDKLIYSFTHTHSFNDIPQHKLHKCVSQYITVCSRLCKLLCCD